MSGLRTRHSFDTIEACTMCIATCCEPVEALHSHISHFVQKLACHCYCDEYSQPDFLFTFCLDVVVVDQEVCMDVCVCVISGLNRTL